MNRKNSKSFDPLQDPKFLQEQLFLTQRALFFAKTVREAKVMQDRINFLKSRIKELKCKI